MPSGLVSIVPLPSLTVTFAGSSPGTLPATRLVIERTWDVLSVVPGTSCSSTAAVGTSCSSANTSRFGMPRLTTAVRTPLIAPSVLDSSPSSARS